MPLTSPQICSDVCCTATRWHITMLAPFGIRPKGTLAVRMLPLAHALMRRGHTVTIVAPPIQNPEDSGTSRLHGAVRVTHTHAPAAALPEPFATLHHVAQLVRPILASPPDIVHVFKPKGYSGLAALLSRIVLPRVALVVDSDDWEGWGGWNDVLHYPLSAKHVFAWQEHHLPRVADAVTVASHTLQTQMWGYGISSARVMYVPNGIDMANSTIGATRATSCANAPHGTTQRKRLLLYTRFWEFCVHDVVAALVAIVQHAPHTQLMVIGKGERGEEMVLQRLCEQSGIAHALDYRGWVEPHNLPALLAMADVALIPLDDTLINRARCSVKMLELMAMGLPLVAGNVGEVPHYIVHGENGFVVEPSNPAALARAALLLLHNDALRVRMGAAARQHIAHYCSWDKLCQAVEQAYGIAHHRAMQRSGN